MHSGFVVIVKDLKPHTNADKLQLATFFGETTCVGLNVKEGDKGIYFPCDLQLSLEYCDANDLCRTKADGTAGSGYLERDKRNVKAIKLRGEKSCGMYMPLESLAFTGADLDSFQEGDTITIVNAIEICRKYIPRGNRSGASGGAGNRTRKHKEPIAPQFAEHADTEQLAYNLSAFKPGDEIEISLKMHGTSQRTGYLPVLSGYKDSIWRKFINKIIMGLKVRKNWGFKGRYALYHSLKHDGEPIYDYDYVTGTRRVVLDDFDGGFYGSNEFREQHAKKFEGKLWKGETVYYEVVSFTHDGTPIMGSAKVPQEARKEYGDKMIFHYGLEEGSDMYVYRMTMTNEDGNVVEYTPSFLRYRCDLMGIKCVPVFETFIIPEHAVNADGTIEDLSNKAGEYVKEKAEQYYDGPDPIGKTHIREGVVVRIINRPKFTAYKHKNFLFKMISGIISEQPPETAISDDIAAEL